jgi:hypothetical protein
VSAPIEHRSELELIIAESERLFDSSVRKSRDHYTGYARHDVLASMQNTLMDSDLTRDQLCTTAALGMRKVAEERERAERYRLAWLSARHRAAGTTMALDEAEEEIEAIRDPAWAEA